jgi:hypothetical protein
MLLTRSSTLGKQHCGTAALRLAPSIDPVLWSPWHAEMKGRHSFPVFWYPIRFFCVRTLVYMKYDPTHLLEERLFAAISANPTISSVTSCTQSMASMRCFTDSLVQIDFGSFGNGLSSGLVLYRGTKTSFSAWSGLSMGADKRLLLSNGTISIPSSICLIRHLPECSLEVLLSSWTGNAVWMLGSGCMLLTVLRGKCMNAIKRREKLPAQPIPESKKG